MKRLMLKKKYLPLYLCLFYGSTGYFSERKHKFFEVDLSEALIKRVSPHNYKLNFRYVAILQSGSFEGYRVPKYQYWTACKN